MTSLQLENEENQTLRLSGEVIPGGGYFSRNGRAGVTGGSAPMPAVPAPNPRRGTNRPLSPAGPCSVFADCIGFLSARRGGGSAGAACAAPPAEPEGPRLSPQPQAAGHGVCPAARSVGCRLWGAGCDAGADPHSDGQGPRCSVWGAGCTGWGYVMWGGGCTVPGAGCGVQHAWRRVHMMGRTMMWGVGCTAHGARFVLHSSWCRMWGAGCGVQCGVQGVRRRVHMAGCKMMWGVGCTVRATWFVLHSS